MIHDRGHTFSVALKGYYLRKSRRVMEKEKGNSFAKSSIDWALVSAMLATASLFGLAGCWVVAAGAGGEAGYIAAQEDRTAGETIDDQAIVTSIKTKMLADQEVPGLDINVDSFKGKVTLRGVVKTQREAERAVELARSVSGVKSVDSRIHVD